MNDREMPRLDPGLNFFGHLVDAGMVVDDLEAFLKTVDGFLGKSARRLAGKYDHFGIDRSSPFTDSFPEIPYASVITAVVAFLERECRTFTEVLREACASPIAARELSGTWLERFRKYSEKIALLPLRLTNGEWEDMRGVVEVRNCLVHAGGWLPDFQGRPTVEAFARRHGLVAIDGDYLHANLPLATMVLEKSRAFIEHIFRAALDRYPKD